MPKLLGCQIIALVATSVLSLAAVAQVSIFGQRDRAYVALERGPIVEVERLYLQCARESEQRVLGFSEAVDCSVAHEVLLRRRFAGDFTAMLAWWRASRPATAEARPRLPSAASDR